MLFKKDKAVSEKTVKAALSRVVAPGIGKDLVSLGFIKSWEISGGKVKVELAIPDPAYPAKDQLVEQCKQALRGVKGVEFAHVSLSSPPKPEPKAQAPGSPAHGQPSKISLPGVKQVIAVASGKGGVGKSTVAVNLACALSKAGKRVGVLDADIYGPSLPTMIGIQQKPAQTNGKILPVVQHDLKVMSMGFMIPEGQPVVWRGPMVHGALTQFMTQVDWGELDYLIIDMPPGTGDAQLTMSQTAPLTGAIIVTTPQEISLIDAQKGLKMFESVQVPILGIVENMSGFTAPDGQRFEIFKSGGGAKLAKEAGVSLLASIPLDPKVAEGGDSGLPVVLGAPDSEVASRYQEMALALQGPEISAKAKFESLSLDWG